MNFKNWVKSIQTAGYNGARTVVGFDVKKGKIRSTQSHIIELLVVFIFFTD